LIYGLLAVIMDVQQMPWMSQHTGANGWPDPCEGKGTSAMTETPTDDQPGFVAKKPEHCFGCYRLIRPGQTYYLTIEYEVLCADCALDEGSIRVREDLAVEVKRDRLLVQRGMRWRGWGLTPDKVAGRH
jgi:hypothetical protein